MMRKITRLVACLNSVIIIGLLAAGMPSLLLAEGVTVDGLQRCTAIDDDTSRLACYDKLGGYRNPAPVAFSEQATVPPDDVGAESLKREEDAKPEPTAITAIVTKCTKDASKKKYIFYLEGGQVWRQLSDKRLHFKECDFNVTISKDFFGYKMQQEGEKVRFRVSRIR